MTKSDNICSSCKFWRYLGIKQGMDENPHGTGQCRRYAPHLLSGAGTGYYIHSLWAITEDIDWCGEYQSKIEPAKPKFVEFQLPLPI